jgi:hypothetical protein
MRHLKLFTPVIFAVLAFGCDAPFFLDSSRLDNTEWIVYEWHSNCSCGCCDYDHDENIIYSELLSLYDQSDGLTQLHFYQNNTFAIIRNDHVVLRGDAKIYSDYIVLYSYSDRLSLTITREQSNTLVLHSEGFDGFGETEVVLKRI